MLIIIIINIITIIIIIEEEEDDKEEEDDDDEVNIYIHDWDIIVVSSTVDRSLAACDFCRLRFRFLLSFVVLLLSLL